tara:strand:+ start:71 stop:517 length:447 start_codon:yes stop_codon:yes gene_type:complete
MMGGGFFLSATRIILISLLLGGTNLEKKATKVLSKHYDRDVILIDTFRRDLDGTLFYISNVDDKVFIGHARSKFDTFDYMVLLDKDNTIKLVRILVYREDYGGEIGSKRWFRQWIGIKQRVNFVDAISGATISINSLKYSINKLLDTL